MSETRRRNTLRKSERLCSERSIDALFAGGRRGSSGPLRFCWAASPLPPADVAGDDGPREKEAPTGPEAAVSVLFSVPKKVFKRAWKRNLIKRRMRESYRCRKHDLAAAARSVGRHIDIAIICSAATDAIPDFTTIDNAIAKILEQIASRNRC